MVWNKSTLKVQDQRVSSGMRRRVFGWVAPDVSKERVILWNLCNCLSSYGVSYRKTSTAGCTIGLHLRICVAKWLGHSRNMYQRMTVMKWSLYVPPSLTFKNSTFCPHSVFMCFVWISQQTAIISLYNINWLVCITETECVYCAVRSVCLLRGTVKLFLGSFAKLRNATISVIMFVRPFDRMEQLDSQ